MLRQNLLQEAVDVVACDRLEAILEGYNSRETNLIVWDPGADLAKALAWLAACAASDRLPNLVVCGGGQYSELEWMLRGFGVVSWEQQRRSPAELAQLCRRLLGLINAGAEFRSERDYGGSGFDTG